MQKMLIMGISNDEAAKRKKEEKRERRKGKEKKMKERKALIETQKGEAKQRKMVYTSLTFFLFFCPFPFLCSDIVARAEVQK